MISLFLASALAADPVALRQIHGPGALLDLGSESLGVAVDVGPVLMGATYRYGATLGAEVGSRRPLGQGDTPWGLDVLGAVGLHALLATPGLALVATGELRGGFRGDHTHLTGGLVAPPGHRPAGTSPASRPTRPRGPSQLQGRSVVDRRTSPGREHAQHRRYTRSPREGRRVRSGLPLGEPVTSS
jgi:hypothetical protein